MAGPKLVRILIFAHGAAVAFGGSGLVGLYRNSELNVKFVPCHLSHGVFSGGLCSDCIQPKLGTGFYCAGIKKNSTEDQLTGPCNDSGRVQLELPFKTNFSRSQAQDEAGRSCLSFFDFKNDTAHVCCTTNDADFHKLKLWESIVTLRSNTLRVVTIERPPFVKLMKRKYTGVIYEFLYALKEKYDLRMTVQAPSDGNWGGKTENGTWSGMIGMIVRKEADLGAAGFSVTLERAKVVHFTWPFHQEPSAILIPPPTEGEKFTVVIRPLSKQVWAALLFTVFALIPTFYFLHLGHAKCVQHSQVNLNVLKVFGDLSWFILGSILQQSLGCPLERTRFLTIIWLFMVVVIANIYLGYLVSYLSAPRLYNVIDSLEDLAHHKKMKWTFRSNTAHFSLFKSETSLGIYKVIGDKTPLSELVTTDSEGIMQTLKFKKAFIKEKSFLDVALGKDFDISKKCRLTLAKKSFFTVGISLAVKKHSPLLEILDTELSNSISTGLMEKWKQKHWPNNLWCADAVSYITSTQPKSRKLKLADLQTAFFLLGCGIFLATFSFLIEYVVVKASQNWAFLVLKWRIKSIWKYYR